MFANSRLWPVLLVLAGVLLISCEDDSKVNNVPPPADDGGGDDGGGDDGGTDDGGDGGSENPSLTLNSPPVANRSIYVDDEAAVRTLTFSYSGTDTIECSRDGGATFAGCDSASAGLGTLIWNVSDYADTHVIRAGSGADAVEVTLQPATQYPGIEFVSCTTTVAADETTDAFDARLGIPASVICFEDGVTVNRFGATTVFVVDLAGNSDTVLIAREGDFAEIRNDADSYRLVELNGADGVRIVGLNLTSVDTALYLPANTLDFTLEYSTVSCSDNGVWCVDTYLAGTSGQPVTIRNSSVTAPANSFCTYALITNSSYVNVFDSTISSGCTGAGVWGTGGAGTLSISNSTVTSTHTAPAGAAAVQLTGPSVTATVSDSTIHTDRLAAFYLSNSNPITLTLNNNTVIRDNVTSGTPTAIDFGSVTPRLDSSQSNLFCRDGTQTFYRIMPYLQSLDGASTFQLSNQTPSAESLSVGGATTFSNCPL
jgi:hypothetical protein